MKSLLAACLFLLLGCGAAYAQVPPIGETQVVGYFQREENDLIFHYGESKGEPSPYRFRDPLPSGKSPAESAREEELARERAEEYYATQEAREKGIREAMALLKPVPSLPARPRYSTRGETALGPSGTLFFKFLRSDVKEMDLSADTLGSETFRASLSTAEDAYRTLYLLQAAAQAQGEEDARFLSDQAALAMEGGPILVVVPEPARAEDSRKRVETFVALQKKVEQAHVAYVENVELRKKVEQERDQVQGDIDRQFESLKKLRGKVREKSEVKPSGDGETVQDSLPPEVDDDPLLREAKALLQKTEGKKKELEADTARLTGGEKESRGQLLNAMRALADFARLK